MSQRKKAINKKKYYYHDYILGLAQALSYETIDEAIIDLYALHQSCNKVGKFLDLSGVTILHRLEEMGIPRRPRGGKRANQKGPPAKYHIGGITLVRWCEEQGISYKMVVARLKRGWSMKGAISTPPMR